MTEETTTIQLLVKTRDALVAIGRKNETYDEVIQRLLGFYRKMRGSED